MVREETHRPPGQNFQVESLQRTQPGGAALETDGRYNEAKILLADCLKVREIDLGPGHPDTLASVRHLGSVLMRQGKCKEAEAMHRRALEGSKNLLGLEHPDTLAIVSNLGSVFKRQDKYQKAEAMHCRALECRERALGLEHPSTLLSIGRLASVRQRQGKHEEAGAMHHRALNRENAPGLEHPGIVASKEYNTLSPVQKISKNPAQTFVANHPLLRFSSDPSCAVPPQYDVNKVD